MSTRTPKYHIVSFGCSDFWVLGGASFDGGQLRYSLCPNRGRRCNHGRRSGRRPIASGHPSAYCCAQCGLRTDFPKNRLIFVLRLLLLAVAVGLMIAPLVISVAPLPEKWLSLAALVSLQAIAQFFGQAMWEMWRR